MSGISLDPRESKEPLIKIIILICKPKGIAWLISKSPGPISNKEDVKYTLLGWKQNINLFRLNNSANKASIKSWFCDSPKVAMLSL